jgi:hypothetical protein
MEFNTAEVLTAVHRQEPREDKFMKNAKFMIAAFSTLLIGCGGSAGIGSGFPDPPKDNALVPTGPGIDGGTVLRTYKAGDTWQFTVGGNMLREDYDDQNKLKSKTSGPVTGQMIRQVSAVTFQGGPALKFTDTLSYKINGGLNTVEILETYGIQQIDGSVTMVGRRDNNADAGVDSKSWIPGTFGAGVNVGGQANFTGLGTYTDSTGLHNFGDFYNTSTALTSTGTTSVVSSTAATPFTAWRSVYSDSYVHNWDAVKRFLWTSEFIGEGYRWKSVEAVSSTDDWNPLWGAPVQRAYQSTRTDWIIDTINNANGIVTYTYHTEKRSLDLKMVLSSHSLQ